jgi:hypothetical protein
MRSKNNQWLERFLSLTWYETILRFVITFIAKTSELLLAAGLIVSTTNFLTDGGILNNNANASVAWGWVQALALDSGLGISFFYVLNCLKQRDWVKFALYTILTVLLALVAGAITNVDTFSHAIHTSMSDAMMRLGFDVKLLSTLRAIAVVGFVSMSRLKDVSFKDLYTPEKVEPPTQAASPKELPAHHITPSHLSVEEVALLLRAFSKQDEITIKQEPQGTVLPSQALFTGTTEQRQQGDIEHQDGAVPAQSLDTETPLSMQLGKAMAPLIPSPLLGQQDSPAGGLVPLAAPQVKMTGAPEPHAEQQSHMLSEPEQPVSLRQLITDHESLTEPPHQTPIDPTSHVALQREAAEVPELHVESHDDSQVEREERLERAFQSLIAEGKKPSGRALAERAHVHRSTCITWLQVRQQKTPLSEQKPAEL